MALPTTLSVATRILWTPPATPTPPTQLFSSAGPQLVPSPQAPGPAPIPTGFAVAMPQYPGMVGSGPFPGPGPYRQRLDTRFRREPGAHS
jgi:hypothetical protein